MSAEKYHRELPRTGPRVESKDENPRRTLPTIGSGRRRRSLLPLLRRIHRRGLSVVKLALVGCLVAAGPATACEMEGRDQVLVSLPVSGDAARFADAVEIRGTLGLHSSENVAPITATSVRGGSRSHAFWDYEFPQLGEGVEVRVLPSKLGRSEVFRVEQREVTSYSLSDEGPHLDLVDWKHGVSEWRVLEGSSPDRFTTTDSYESGQVPFPSFTEDELVGAIRRLLGEGQDESALERWVSVLKYGSAGVSHVELRISVHQGGRWVPLHTVVLEQPMGC